MNNSNDHTSSLQQEGGFHQGGVDSSLSDVDVVHKVIDGDCDAFEIIMRRYNQRLFRVARSIIKNDADAEDVVQESYINAYTNLSQYSRVGSFSGWLTRIVVNQSLSKKRAMARRATHSQQLYLNDMPTEVIMADDAILPDRQAHSSGLRKLIEQAIDTLPDEFRTVFVMRVIEQLTVRETAQALSLEEATVKTRQYRAVRRLREQLDSMYDQQIVESFSFDGARCDRIVTQTLQQIRHR